MHQSFVTTVPTYWEGWGNSKTNVRGYNFSILPAVWGKCQGYNFTPKQRIRMLTPLKKYFKEYSMHVLMELGPRGKGSKSRAITISLSPQCGCYNRALRNENYYPCYSLVGWGLWLQMTVDWCLTQKSRKIRNHSPCMIQIGRDTIGKPAITDHSPCMTQRGRDTTGRPAQITARA